MTPREIDDLRRRIRQRPVDKPKIPDLKPAPAAPRVDTIWVAPKQDARRMVRSAALVFTPFVAGAIALVAAAWAGLF